MCYPFFLNDLSYENINIAAKICESDDYISKYSFYTRWDKLDPYLICPQIFIWV